MVKSFNLQQKRPKVLLFGNGLTYSEDTKWGEIISKLSEKRSADISEEEIPYSVLATIQTDITDKNRHNTYYNFFRNEYAYHDYPALRKLLAIPFDAVLTTNYTYEAEECFVDGFHEKSNTALDKYWTQTKTSRNRKIDAKYLLHTFNQVSDGTISQDIWHIHGEVRRKSSMILTHDEYSRLICELVKYNEERGRDYYKYSDDVCFESWVDYLLLGDLHIIGFGFDFSEFDLWWLLTRRLKEKAGAGKLFFYAPEDEKNRAVHEALRAMGATVEHCGVKASDKDAYQTLYDRAAQLIKEA